MQKPTIIISMPKNSTKEEIADMRNKYKDEHKVYLIVSGDEAPKTIMKNFLLDSLTK